MYVTSFLFLVLAGNSALTNGLLLELHAFTLVDRSYALLVCSTGYYSRSAVFNSPYRYPLVFTLPVQPVAVKPRPQTKVFVHAL